MLPPFLYRNSPYSHSGCISCLTFSADGKILASASSDQTIRLWGKYTGELKRTLNAHSDTVLSIAISPDSQTLASASADQTIRLWSLTSYEQPRILRGHSGWVTAVAINPDGNILVSGSTDGTVKLWNLNTGQLIKTLDEESTGVFAVAISSDGEILASAGTKTVKLWNLRTGEQLCTLAGCSPVAFSPDRKTLVSGGDQGTIKIWSQMLSTDESILEPLVSGEWWEVLGVGRDANLDTVKLAYRQLARQYHPDINRTGTAITKMQAINRAYEAFLQEFSRVWGG
ncbi:MAG: DnaJ domain-containing protein [Symploca sp. SIO2E6]|nr:DnaJ domain-containing protein [Symploca sp. SIO2E6]